MVTYANKGKDGHAAAYVVGTVVVGAVLGVAVGLLTKSPQWGFRVFKAVALGVGTPMGMSRDD